MTCREFTTFIAEFIDGQLPAQERQAFEQHLRVCTNCARYLDDYRTAMALGQRAFDDQDAAVPGEVPEELVDAILRARRGPAGD